MHLSAWCQTVIYSPAISEELLPRKLTWLAGKSTMNEDAFPIENGDFPASHVSELGGVNKQWDVLKTCWFELMKLLPSQGWNGNPNQPVFHGMGFFGSSWDSSCDGMECGSFGPDLEVLMYGKRLKLSHELGVGSWGNTYLNQIYICHTVDGRKPPWIGYIGSCDTTLSLGL